MHRTSALASSRTGRTGRPAGPSTRADRSVGAVVRSRLPLPAVAPGAGSRPRHSNRRRCVSVRALEGSLAEVAQRASLALLTSTSSAMLSAPDFIQPDLQQQLPPLLEPPTAQVLEFDRTIPRSGDMVQYIVRAIDEDHQNPALSEARRTPGWSTEALDLAVAITSLPQSLWRAYTHALQTHPFAAKLGTGLVGTILGDTLAQLSSARTAASARRQQQQPRPSDAGSEGGAAMAAAEGGDEKGEWRFDVARCARLTAYSVVVGTPLCHLWFSFLDSSVFPGAPTSPLAVATKVVMDQALMAPFGTSLFFAAIKALEGHPEQALPTVRSRLWPTMMASYSLWPAAHVVNFAFVPSELRILYVNAISILWTAYLSHMANESEQPQQQQQQPKAAAPESAGTVRLPALSAMRKQ